MLALLSSTINSACMVFGVRTVETTDYRVLLSEEELELRLYPSYLVAQTVVDGDFKQASSDGFRRLAGYIFGKNAAKRSIAMTAPVVSEKIAMTAPVVQEKRDGRWTMAFMMPSSYSRETLPEPLDPRVTISEVPQRLVAVVRYSGVTDEAEVDRRSAQLSEWIARQGFEALSSPRCARYDPPFTIPFLRRNEVHITVENKTPQGTEETVSRPPENRV